MTAISVFETPYRLRIGKQADLPDVLQKTQTNSGYEKDEFGRTGYDRINEYLDGSLNELNLEIEKGKVTRFPASNSRKRKYPAQVYLGGGSFIQ